MNDIVIATIKEWNIKNYFSLVESYKHKYQFHLITHKNALNYHAIKQINPSYIFFPHWSWIIPSEIYANYECIVFHMTDLPFGRGGSPFQNLIIREIYDTKISAIKVAKGLDTGDIYLKEDFNISVGSAEENFIHMSNVIYRKMIPKILEATIIPVKQIGEPTTFERRKIEESDINTLHIKSISKLYDFIRMLDAEGYPNAYLDLGNIRISFNEVHLKNNKLVGRFEVNENV